MLTPVLLLISLLIGIPLCLAAGYAAFWIFDRFVFNDAGQRGRS